MLRWPQDLANIAIAEVAAQFAANHTDSQVVLFPLADVQRGLIANADNLDFVNAVIGCTSFLTFTQYALGCAGIAA